MSSSDRPGALAALEAARPVLARLSGDRDPEDTARDLSEAWNAVAAALTALVGGTSLVGQALIRETRLLQLLTFDQANALAEFNAAVQRAGQPGYRGGRADVDAARAGIEKLMEGLAGAGTDSLAMPPAAPTAPTEAAVPRAANPISTPRRRWPRWLMPLGLAGGFIGLALAGKVMLAHGGTDATVALGIRDYVAGKRDSAASEFTKATLEDPSSARPHLYLARIAREDGKFSIANDELQTALKLDQSDEQAMREMGSLLLAEGKFDLARSFYVHALQVNANDSAARGWLGCALIRLGRGDDGEHWLGLAGKGPWSVCKESTAGSSEP